MTVPSATEPKKRCDIDWLRVGAVLLLIPFHTARIFDIWEPNYVKNADMSPFLSYLCIGFVGPWHMPLLFTLAGAATWLALRHRTPGQYVAERTRRLFVPLLFGVLAIVPPQAYLARVGQFDYTGSYLDFLADYFGRLRGDLSGYSGLFTPGHLWFILYLFGFSLLALPLFVYLRGRRSGRLSQMARFVTRPGGLFLLAIPLTLTEVLPAPGGKNPFFYILLFVYGYLLLADERFQQAVERDWKAALALGTVTTVIVLAVWASHPAWDDYAWQSILFAVVRNLNTWFWVIAWLGLGRASLNVGSKVLRYASEAAYPFYILHQTVIIAIGFFVVRWALGVWPKFLFICVSSTLGTLAIYDLLVKRSNVVRFLFGMKPLQREKAENVQAIHIRQP